MRDALSEPDSGIKIKIDGFLTQRFESRCLARPGALNIVNAFATCNKTWKFTELQGCGWLKYPCQFKIMMLINIPYHEQAFPFAFIKLSDYGSNKVNFI